MDQKTNIKNKTEELQKLLLQSIQMYSEIESIYLEIHHTSSESSSLTIDTNNQKLNLLFHDVKQVESPLAQLIASTDKIVDKVALLIKKRVTVIESVYNWNRSLVNKTSNIASLLQHEINTVANGRSAIKCYKPLPDGRKGLISNSF
jgi:uncharacterized protein YoxC